MRRRTFHSTVGVTRLVYVAGVLIERKQFGNLHFSLVVRDEADGEGHLNGAEVAGHNDRVKQASRYFHQVPLEEIVRYVPESMGVN